LITVVIESIAHELCFSIAFSTITIALLILIFLK